MNDFLRSYNLFNRSQFEFQENKVTFANISDSIYDNMDKGLKFPAVFINLAKAFHTLEHDTLLQKLKLKHYLQTIWIIT